MIKTIPLNCLKRSNLNVRKTKTNQDIEELKASILHHGLQQNLVVTVGSDDSTYEVVAGGRRLSALQALQQEGKLTEDYTVPCQIIDSDNATEISLAENTVRVAMHPADQFEVWASLIDTGNSISQIAARFGVSENLVRKRLKLGKVAPELIQAYREEQMDMEHLMAFTLTDDRGWQLGLWEELKNSGYISSYQIRRALTEESIKGDSKLAKFVGIETYEAAGGTLRRDLFGDDADCYLDNPELLRQLAIDKLTAKAKELEARWKWTKPVLEDAYKIVSEYQRIFPQPDCDREFTQEDRQKAGCIITIRYDGEFDYYEGLVAKEDLPEQDETISDNFNATPNKDSEFSQKLCSNLATYRLQIVKAHLAKDFNAAFDLTLYTMCHQNLLKYSTNPIVNMNVNPVPLYIENLTNTTASKTLEAQYEKLQLDWLDIPEPERFTAFCNLSHQKKQALFSWCIAQATQHQLSINQVFESIGKRLNIKVEEWWKPTAENFFNHIKKQQLLALGEKIFGCRWRRENEKAKKSVLATTLEQAFEPSSDLGSTLDSESKAFVASWLPEGMGFFNDGAESND